MTAVFLLAMRTGSVAAQSAVPAAPRAAAAPAPASRSAEHVSDAEVARLDQALQHLVDIEPNAIARGVAGVILGGGFVAFGVYTALADDDAFGTGAARATAAGVLIGLGGVYAANGARAFDAESTDRRRLDRFHTAMVEGKLDPRTFARFEGGLFAEAEMARQLRLQNGVSHVGMTIAGGGVLALSLAAPDYDDDARLAGSVVGGL